jgi:hypothetical protein
MARASGAQRRRGGGRCQRRQSSQGAAAEPAEATAWGIRRRSVGGGRELGLEVDPTSLVGCTYLKEVEVH